MFNELIAQNMLNQYQYLAERYNITPSFLANYFAVNAFEKYTRSLQEFMFWRRGSFLPPHKKEQYLQSIIEQEIKAYYEGGIFCLPSVQFAVTTRCTLRCRECSVMIPRFGRNGISHTNLTFEHFRRECDALLDSVDHMGTLLLLGGEPLLNKELAQMLAYAAAKDKVGLVDIVTNCTLVPSIELLEAAKDFRHKVFFGLSNYSGNPALTSVLKREEIIALLKQNDIKHSLDAGDVKWFKYELLEYSYSDEQMQAIFTGCQWHHCLYVLDGILAVCPRSLIGCRLGAFELKPDDMIDLRESQSREIRAGLIRFYEKNSLDACRYCYRHDGLVTPAEQLKPGVENT
jgi:organic radical activating enzyme